MRRSVKRALSLSMVLALGLACLFSTSSCGSKPNSWTDLKPSGALPSARFGQALLYLSATGKVFMFGGAADEVRPLNDTWMYDSDRNSWVDLKPSGEAPPGRWAMGAAYDPAANKVVIFGGMGEGGGLLNDTWAYDVAKNAWSKLAPSTSPSIRYRATMAYDQATGRLMLFGGRYLRTTASGYFQQDHVDTWAFDLAQDAWTDLGPSGASPAPSSGSATLLSTGPSRSLLLLAGVPPLPPVPPYIPPDKLDKNWSTWRYDAAKNAWTSGAPPALSPVASQYYALTFDSTLGEAVLFGGQDRGTLNAGTLNDTWIYDPAANTWVLALAGGSDTPSPRIDHGMVYDPKADRVILFGGRSADGKTADLPNETWGYMP